jgi:hypothetical protein
MPSPLPSKGLIMKSLDESEARGARYPDNILPLFAPLEDLCGNSSKLSGNAPMLVDLPHTLKLIYQIRYVKDSATPYRGAKVSLYEGGHREPLLARWPGKIPANSR